MIIVEEVPSPNYYFWYVMAVTVFIVGCILWFVVSLFTECLKELSCKRRYPKLIDQVRKHRGIMENHEMGENQVDDDRR